jgi:hypothetical protein
MDALIDFTVIDTVKGKDARILMEGRGIILKAARYK